MLIFAAGFYVTLSMSVTEEALNARSGETPRPYIVPAALEAPTQGAVSAYFPYPIAGLAEQAGALESEQASDVPVAGQTCRVIERVYVDAQGGRVTVRSATPAAYMTAYADCAFTEEGYTVADGMLAQYMAGAERVCLLMRSGETVYAVETQSGQNGKEALLRAAAYLTFE